MTAPSLKAVQPLGKFLPCPTGHKQGPSSPGSSSLPTSHIFQSGVGLYRLVPAVWNLALSEAASQADGLWEGGGRCVFG